MNHRTPNPILVALAMAAGTAACGSSDGGSDNDGDNTTAVERQTLLRSVTDNVIVPAYQRFADSTATLAQRTSDYAQAIGTPGAAAALEAAESAFGAAYREMQYVELLQIGPYGSAARFVGGQGIREQVYSWPATNPCQVDVKLVAEAHEDPQFFETSLENVYGFDALEYLLNAEGPDNACAAPVSINTNGSWAALGQPEIDQRRADYAARVAGEIASQASALLTAWTGGFADELRNAGGTGMTYSTAQAALDDLFASIFYLETNVKDRKLAAPLGISPDCSATSCPDLLESQFGNLSLTAIETNIAAYRDIYFGGPASVSNRYGFGDLLRSENATQLADDLDAATALAISRAPLVSEPLSASLESDPPRDLHTAVKSVTDILKSQLPSVLSLRVPNEGAADND